MYFLDGGIELVSTIVLLFASLYLMQTYGGREIILLSTTWRSPFFSSNQCSWDRHLSGPKLLALSMSIQFYILYIYIYFVVICLCNFSRILCTQYKMCTWSISIILIKLYQGLQNKTGVKGTRAKLLMISFQWPSVG